MNRASLHMNPTIFKLFNRLFALGPGVSKLEYAIIFVLIATAVLASLIAVSDSLAAAYSNIVSG